MGSLQSEECKLEDRRSPWFSRSEKYRAQSSGCAGEGEESYRGGRRGTGQDLPAAWRELYSARKVLVPWTQRNGVCLGGGMLIQSAVSGDHLAADGGGGLSVVELSAPQAGVLEQSPV